MSASVVLDAINVTCLAAALVLFSFESLGRGTGHPSGPIDFGAGFSAFLAGWIATELLEALAPATWGGTVDFLHFAVLASFALWINARWRWSLRRAREEP